MSKREVVFSSIIIMLVVVLVLGLFATAGWGSSPEEDVRPSFEEIKVPTHVNRLFVVHDDKRGVTCYVTDYQNTALFCIPDRELK